MFLDCANVFTSVEIITTPLSSQQAEGPEEENGNESEDGEEMDEVRVITTGIQFNIQLSFQIRI